MANRAKPSYLNFNSDTYPWKPEIDYRRHPKRYRVGKGEQGVLICEPYKSELLPHWRFKTSAIATASSRKLYKAFLVYLDKDDFVGADMARKFLQMGFTRARRYANYKGGKKYNAEKDYEQNPRGTGDPEKAAAAEVFYKVWKKAEAEPRYAERKSAWKKELG